MLEPDRASWQNPRILGLLLMVFLLGGVVGALVMKVELHDRLHRTAAASQPAFEKLTYDWLCKDLHLSPEQSNQPSLHSGRLRQVQSEPTGPGPGRARYRQEPDPAHFERKSTPAL